MTLILCLDPKGGMTFNGRRQTLDYEVVADISVLGNKKLYISPFSESYFMGRGAKVVDEPLKDAPSDATVFIEDTDPLPYLDKVEKIIIFRWGEVYPQDCRLSFDPCEKGFKKLGEMKYSTKVHQNIKKEIYKR